jgi:hypothetical protein
MAKTPLPRAQLQILAKVRLREAEALYKASLYDGSVSVAGYAVELALKARICRLLGLKEYPLEPTQAFKIHNLEQLKVLAGLTAHIDASRNRDLFNNWSIAVAWNPEQRYDAPGKYNAVTAKRILDSIREKPNGVLTWLSKRW